MSIVKNYFYNVAYQVLLIILPIITIPYVTRVLGSNDLGINAYTSSIVQYFTLFGTLGIALYGSRAVAYVRDDKVKLSKTFWSIFILKLITTLISYLFFIWILVFWKNTYKMIYLIQSINIIAAAIDISWLFMGIEDFKRTVTRNMVIKIVSFFSIFVFVRTSGDLFKYILINSLAILLGQAILWFYIPKLICWVKVDLSDIKMHIIPSTKLFIPQIATQIYCVFDKTVLGMMSTNSEVGFYDMGEKIVYMVLTLVTSMGSVMLPRISNIYNKGDIDKIKQYIIKSFNFASYLAVPMAFGLMGIANGFAIWFFGKDFMKSGNVIFAESFMLIAVAWSSVTGVQLMIPLKKENELTISFVVGAFVNIISNLILVRFLFSVGAAISTVLAEFSVTIIQIYLMKNFLPLKDMFKDIWKYLTSGIIMYLCVYLIGIYLHSGFLSTMVQIFCGAFAYFITQSILKSDFQNTVLCIAKQKLGFISQKN